MSKQVKHFYDFGRFSLNATRRLLYRDGEPVQLAPKVLETLFALVENRGRALSKDELLELVWGETIVEEGGLARNVSLLRRALGERPDQHRYIVTLPARGYQFVADVQQRWDSGEASSSDESSGHAPGFAPKRTLLYHHRLILGGWLVLALGTVIYIVNPTRSTTSARPRIQSIAVLPLANLSSDPSQDFFADGMTEALISSLAQMRALKVISRTSVMRFKGTRKPLREIAQELNVDAVIEGSVQRSGKKIKIMTQLIHGPTDTHLWAREYEREGTDILKLQAEVARAVGEEIRIQVTAEEQTRMASTPAVNTAAHEQYLIGRYHLWKYTDHDLRLAVDHFESATRIDPNYAAAYAGLSHAWWAWGTFGGKSFKDTRTPSSVAARKALELDDGLAEARVSLGRVKYAYDWDWPGAEREFRSALDIDSNSLDAHYFYAMLLMGLGRFTESIAQIQKAEHLDPLSSTVQSGFGRILYRAGDFDGAVRRLNRALELEPRNQAAYGRLADVYSEMGRHVEAVASLEKARSLGDDERAAQLARLYARMGRRTEARRLLKDLEVDSKQTPVLAAGAYAALGDKDHAFRLLFRVVEEHASLAIFIKEDPPLDSLHADPRWGELLHRLNFPAE